VVELIDYTPIRSVKELLGEDAGAILEALDEAGSTTS
jgi:hypothetical protein